MKTFYLLLLAVFNAVMISWLGSSSAYYRLSAYTWESDEFRKLSLGREVASWETMDAERLAALMVEHGYDLTGLSGKEAARESNPADLHALFQGRPAAFRKLVHAYETIFRDLVYFPIPVSSRPDTPDVAYEDSWQQKRTYGGERGHEGCDIMGTQRERGFYPVVSISDGVIERIGWLEQGGWRIGIRTESGLYLYYAHLYSYADGLAQGDSVRAGELLGYMGDSGYGKQENTVGNFEVHLHVGMYVKTDHFPELSVNPYWVLYYLEKHRQVFSY